MTTRKQQLFEAKQKKQESNLIPSTIKFEIDKGTRTLKIQSAESKMLIALRKVLTKMSDSGEGEGRYYIAGPQVQVISAPAPTGDARKGAMQTYFGKGRCRVGLAHRDGTVSFRVIEFSVTFRDTQDERGIADVDYIDPTTVDKLSPDTVLK
jgi:hypothetical protein